MKRIFIFLIAVAVFLSLCGCGLYEKEYVSVKDYEPLWALDGGEDGLKFYKAIIRNWKVLLTQDGIILFEVGEGQADEVKEMLLSAGFASAETRRDTIGVERVVIGRMAANG